MQCLVSSKALTNALGSLRNKDLSVTFFLHQNLLYINNQEQSVNLFCTTLDDRHVDSQLDPETVAEVYRILNKIDDQSIVLKCGERQIAIENVEVS